MTWKYVSSFFTFNRQCCLGNSTLNISSPLHSGHHYFDETSLLCEGPFPSHWFQDSLLTIWPWEVQVWSSFSLSCFVYFEVFQVSRLKFFIKFKELLVFISSNILSAPPPPDCSLLRGLSFIIYVIGMFDIISQVSETLLISKLIFPLIAQTVWSQLKYGQIGYFFLFWHFKSAADSFGDFFPLL